MPARVSAADIEEEAYLVDEPVVAAINVALAKAKATQAEADEVIVAADTLVVVDGEVLGKPADSAAAREMLDRLRAHPHHVLTGVVLQREEQIWAGVVTTRVVMRDYSGSDIEDYITRGEPFDKAGGYAVQDQTFRPVERLDGCYLNVVGLPLCAVAAGLNALGIAAETAREPPCAYCQKGQDLVRSG